jgi:hypothetical protein
MDATHLMRVYPWLDHMMADTLIKMSQQGKLQSYVDAMPEHPRPTSEVVVGAIEVESPAEKIATGE